MRTLPELLELNSPAWPLVQEWLAAATRPVEVLAREAELAEATLLKLQVTTRSTMGAVAYETGGILIDHGWVRVLGSGCRRMPGNLVSWNAFGGAPEEGLSGLLVVAHDALGGFFALDGGALGDGRGGAFYFAPDSLRWEDLGQAYSDLIRFLLLGDLADFYGEYRWPGWSESVGDISPDQGFSLYPPLWSKEGKDVTKVSRRAVPMRELLALQLDLARQFDRSP